MKHTKEFFGVLFSILVCVFLVGLGVYATTTVGNNITAGGTIAINGSAHDTELSVIGTASVSEDLWASGSFQFGGGNTTATVSYSRLGAGTTGHSLADADDLLITGLLEVDDAVYFDSTVSISTSLRVPTIYGDTDAGQYLRIGDQAITSHSLNAVDDLLVTGDLEVDGLAYFDGAASVSAGDLSVEAGDFSVDGTASMSGGLQIGGGSTLFGGTASPTGATLNCSAGDIYFRSGQSDSTLIINVCDATNTWTPASISYSEND